MFFKFFLGGIMKAWETLKLFAPYFRINSTMKLKSHQSFIIPWNGHLPLNNVIVLQKYFSSLWAQLS